MSEIIPEWKGCILGWARDQVGAGLHEDHREAKLSYRSRWVKGTTQLHQSAAEEKQFSCHWIPVRSFV